MRIGLLHYAAPPVVGGVESVIGHHASLMVEDGHKVSILAGRGAQTNSSVPFISLPLVDSRHPQVLAVKSELDAGRVTPLFDSLVVALEETLWEHLLGMDVLIAHNVCSLNKNLPLTAALKNLCCRPGAPRLILWHHDLAWTTSRYRAELHAAYPWDLLKTDWSEALQVTVSEPRRHELAELLGVPVNRIIVVPNGIEAGKFLKLEDQTLGFVNEMKLLAADPLLLLPVRITPRKNIELAIRTLAVLRDHLPEVKLVVTGPLGPHNPANSAYFNQLIAIRTRLDLDNAVIFLAEHTPEYLPDEVIADFYRLADALLLPSLEEGFGIPILESGLVGLPVFCADIPALRDLGEGFVTFFSPQDSPVQVAALIEKRLSLEPACGLRRRVKQEYTWEHIYTERIRPLLSM